MSRIHTFTVTLEFCDKITQDEELMEVTHNIAEAIKCQADTAGVAPEFSDTFLTKVYVKHEYLDNGVGIVIFNG